MSLCALLMLSACEPRSAASVAWDGHEFVEVGSLASLPAAIQDSLGARRVGAGGIAERGARFNTTEVVKPGLPMRRFVIAGLAPDAALVAYERGGRGYSVGILLFKRSGSGVRRVNAWTTYDPPDGLVGLIKSVRAASAPRPPKPVHRSLRPHPRAKRIARPHAGGALPPVLAPRAPAPHSP